MRYNTFYQVHKALRAMLYETATELQHTDFNSREEVTSLLANITTVVDVFDKHAYNEDHFVFPAVEQEIMSCQHNSEPLSIYIVHLNRTKREFS